jgi:putative spermidine/putrescine transport system ATP-binding protein
LTVRCGAQHLQADLPTHAGGLPDKGAQVLLGVFPQDVTFIGQVA